MTKDRLIKIVRDRIEEFVGPKKMVYRHATHDEVVAGLKSKLVEEAVEYIQEPSLEELADVYEVIKALAYHVHSRPIETVAARAAEKALERGAFDKGVGMYAVQVEDEFPPFEPIRPRQLPSFTRGK